MSMASTFPSSNNTILMFAITTQSGRHSTAKSPRSSLHLIIRYPKSISLESNKKTRTRMRFVRIYLAKPTPKQSTGCINPATRNSKRLSMHVLKQTWTMSKSQAMSTEQACIMGLWTSPGIKSKPARPELHWVSPSRCSALCCLDSPSLPIK